MKRSFLFRGISEVFRNIGALPEVMRWIKAKEWISQSNPVFITAVAKWNRYISLLVVRIANVYGLMPSLLNL